MNGPLYSLEDKVVLINGGGSGFARQVALEAAEMAARVLVIDLNVELSEETANSIVQRGGEADFVAFDLQNPAAHEAAVEAAVKRWGRLDAAFNSSGRGGPMYAKMLDLDAAAWQRTMDGTIGSLWFALRAQIAQMRGQQSGGSIVNAAAGTEREGNQLDHARNAGKYAIIGLTQSVALEYVHMGVRVNAVCPVWKEAGPNPTPPLQSPPTQTNIPTDPSKRVLWLMSDAATFLNGVALPIHPADG